MIKPSDIKPPSTKKAEQIIDKALKEAAAEDRWPCNIAASLVKPCRVEDVVDAYSKAGWKVTVVPDWREGDYLEFKRP